MTSSETPNGSGSAIFEAAKKLMEAVTGKDEHAPADPKAMAKIIAEKKAAARKITEGLEKTPEKTEQELKNIPAESTNLKEAKARLEVAKATPQAKNVAWLVDSVGDLQHNANAIAFVARIAEAPVELQEDPHYLLAEGAKLFWSTPWAELSGPAHDEAYAVLRSINQRVEVLRAKNPDFTVSKDTVRYALNPVDRQSMMPRPTPHRLPDNWFEELALPTDPATGNLITLSPEATTIMNEIKQLGNHQNYREISNKWSELSDVWQHTTDPQERAYLEGVKRKLYENIGLMNGDRLVLDLDTITKITRGPTAAQERDKLFYQRIKKILENPNEETHKQINLYDQVDMDTLMGAFSQAVEIDPGTGQEHRIGHMVQGHYQNLYDTILRLSDAEFWARHPAGDVENLSKTLGYFENKFAVEAMSDPLVEDMTQCMELAIKFVRDMNNGTIPGELSRFDPHSQVTYIDQLTLQFMKQRIESKAVKDYVRDPHSGIPEIDPTDLKGTTYKRSDRAFHFQGLTHEEEELRLLATLRLAKGVGIITNRTIELYAFTNTPGVPGPSEAGSRPDFSSKAYGGLTRWTNPLSEWFEMYRFGDTLYQPFFNALLGVKGKPFNWSMDQFKQAIDLAMEGGSNKMLRDKFGPDATRIMDMIQDFSFSGRFGPLSMWGTKDATKNWTAKEYERIGGSMRLSLAGSWAETKIRARFEQANAGRGWNARQMSEEWTKAKLGEENWSRDLQWKKEVDTYTKAYKTLIWSQSVMRNPLGAAAAMRVEYRDAAGGVHNGKLKSKILREIFTREDLAPYGLTELVVERDISSPASVPVNKRDLMERISVLDSDVSAVMRHAMNTEDFPRDIREEDFARCIVGDMPIKTVNGREVIITEETRRRQAIEFWKKTQQDIFGKAVGEAGPGFDAQQIRTQLGVDGYVATVKSEDLVFQNIDRLDAIIDNPASTRATMRLSELLEQKFLVHLGTEDTQWRYLDLNTLGDRNWLRRGGDNLTRAKTIQLMMKYFDGLVGKPKVEDIVKALAEIAQQEKQHDPKEAAKFAYIWGTATADIYRQRHLAGVPILGRILPVLGVPMSIAQEKMGIHSAAFWSANNMLKYADLIGEKRIIPEKRVIDGNDFGPYTMKKFKKDVGASRVAAVLEMIVIGYSLAAIAVALSAGTKSIEEESKK